MKILSNKGISYIKRACKITDNIFSLILKGIKIKKFETELDIKKFIKNKAKEDNCELAFKPVVAIGKNAAEIHHTANKTRLKKGFLVIDLGVKYKGYCSDMTRTIYIGNPSKKERKLYNLVLESQLTAFNHTQPEVYAADIDLIARAVLQDYYKHFVHGTGHGVGKKIHQAPSLKPRGRFRLKPNTVITIEPGLYFKKRLGIRIEDSILMKERPIQLTKTTKKLIVIK